MNVCRMARCSLFFIALRWILFLVLLNENVGKRIRLPRRITRATRQLRRSKNSTILFLSVFFSHSLLPFSFSFFSSVQSRAVFSCSKHFRSFFFMFCCWQPVVSFESCLNFVYCAFLKLKLIWSRHSPNIPKWSRNVAEWQSAKLIACENVRSEYHLEHKPLRIHCVSECDTQPNRIMEYRFEVNLCGLAINCQFDTRSFFPAFNCFLRSFKLSALTTKRMRMNVNELRVNATPFNSH